MQGFVRRIICEEQGSIFCFCFHIFVWSCQTALPAGRPQPQVVMEIELPWSTQTSPVWVVMLITAPFLFLGVTQMTEMTVVE